MNSPHHVEFTDNFVGGFYIAHLHTKTLYVPTKRSSLSHLSISLLINTSHLSLSLSASHRVQAHRLSFSGLPTSHIPAHYPNPTDLKQLSSSSLLRPPASNLANLQSSGAQKTGTPLVPTNPLSWQTHATQQLVIITY